MPDCVVVGAGVFGSWAALRLRESGRSVTLVEAFGSGHAKSSSGGASRVIRMGYGADEIYTRWAMRSLAAWKELFARARQPELFQPTGVLWTAAPGHAYTSASIELLARLGVKHVPMDTGELRRRYPAMHFDAETMGVLEPESGALLANRAVRTVTQMAIAAGVEVVTARIVPPCEEGPLDAVIAEDSRTLSAANFVFACGPWLPKLFPRAIAGRIQARRQPVFYFDSPANDMPVWIDFSDPRGPYTIPPLAGKGFKLALDERGPEFDPDTGSREVTAVETAAARALLAERFPSLAAAPLLETEICQYEDTSTGDFLIDRHPRMSNAWLVGGGSGHGFKHGPAVGEYLTALLDGAAREARFSWSSKSTVRQRSVY